MVPFKYHSTTNVSTGLVFSNAFIDIKDYRKFIKESKNLTMYYIVKSELFEIGTEKFIEGYEFDKTKNELVKMKKNK